MAEESDFGNRVAELEEISAGIVETLAFVERWRHSPQLTAEQS